MDSSVAAATAVITAFVLSWLFRQARKPVPAQPDGTVLVTYGKGMLAIGLACGVLMPVGLVFFAFRVGFKRPDDVYYWAGMTAFFLLVGCWLLLEALKRRIVVSPSGVLAHSPWGQPKSIAWADVAQLGFSAIGGSVSITNRSKVTVRASLMMNGIGQLIAAARERAPANVSRAALDKVEARLRRSAI